MGHAGVGSIHVVGAERMCESRDAGGCTHVDCGPVV